MPALKKEGGGKATTFQEKVEVLYSRFYPVVDTDLTDVKGGGDDAGILPGRGPGIEGSRRARYRRDTRASKAIESPRPGRHTERSAKGPRKATPGKGSSTYRRKVQDRVLPEGVPAYPDGSPPER